MSPFVAEDPTTNGIQGFKDRSGDAVLGVCQSNGEENGHSQEACLQFLSSLQSNLGEYIESKSNNSQTEKHQLKRMLKSFSLEGRVCIVTGGASGIGLEICRAILASGGQVAIVDANGIAAEQQAEILASSYQSLNSGERSPLVTAHTADVSSPTSIELSITSIIQQHKKIDHLVTSAGICENFPAVSYPYSRMQRLWSINVDGTYCFATAVARHMILRGVGGSMVFIGSMSGSIVNVPQLQTPYNVSKAAVRHMARSLAVEWAGQGIRVNVISPGYMRTPLTEEIMKQDPPLYQNWVSRTPLNKLGKPADIAGAAVYLLSDASSYMTGAEILIDGGYSAI